jgi:hypothetical protein
VGGRALGRQARRRADGQGHRVGDAAGWPRRPGGPARGLGPRRPRLDVRRQPGRLCRGARDDRPARGWLVENARVRGDEAFTGLAELVAAIPASSPRSAARA